MFYWCIYLISTFRFNHNQYNHYLSIVLRVLKTESLLHKPIYRILNTVNCTFTNGKREIQNFHSEQKVCNEREREKKLYTKKSPQKIDLSQI